MTIRFHPHARERMKERGAADEEVIGTVESGERYPGKFGRTGFRRNFAYSDTWLGREYGTKQVEVYAEEEDNGWLVITVITRYF